MARNKYDATTYAVGLSILANSFFDAECGANLFKSSPVYQFNHKPTNAIITAIKSGRLVDIKKNILDGGQEAVDVKKLEAEIRAKVEKELAAKQGATQETEVELPPIEPTVETAPKKGAKSK